MINANNKKKLLILAGGTGGHIFPGLEIANYLIKKNWEIRWIGAYNQMESEIIPKYSIKIYLINISGIRNKCIWLKIKSIYKLIKAIFQSKKIIQYYRPDIVLGLGGYVSGPGGIASWLSNIPLIIHEQNIIPGMTNKYLFYFANTVLQAFPGSFHNAEVVGNPIRNSIKIIPCPKKRFLKRTGPIRVLIMGGSQGSRILNKVIPKLSHILRNNIKIWHQVGKGYLNQVRKKYFKINHYQYKITEFINNISRAYEWADIIICRSGALTVSEISAVGIAAIFVPFEHSDYQQYFNAYYLEKIGAAIIIQQSILNEKYLAKILMSYTRKQLLSMAEKAYTLNISNATSIIANKIIKLTK